MNPSTQELLDAVDASGAYEVILLPNNKNIIMAANQVDALTTKTVGVVPTRSIPAALSALTAFSADRDLAANIETMEDATADCLAISITRAVRAVDLNGVTVSQGELIGLVDDELAVAGTDDTDVFQKTLAKSGAHDPELFTIFVGEDVSPDDAQEFETALVDAWPDAEVETHPGGQPHYRYIISIE